MLAASSRAATAIARGLLSGACVGGLDACDAIAGGFATSLALHAQIALVVVLAGLGSAVGALVGAAVAAAVAVAPAAALVTPACLPAAAAFALGAITAALAFAFRMLLVTPPALVAAAALAAGGLLAILAWRWRDRRLVPLLVWVVVFAWAYAIGARLLYPFSRAGAATVAHAGWALGLIALGIAVLSTAPLATMTRTRGRLRLASGLVVGALAALAGARPLLDHAPHAFRLVLYERTSFAYRLLASLPGDGLTLDELARGCPPSPAPPPPPPAPALRPSAPPAPPVRGVVVIVVDALRGDRVPSPVAPRMSALAAEAAAFTRAYAPAPATRQAIEAMMTGRTPSAQTGRRRARSIRPALAAAGVRTLAVSGSPMLARWLGDFDVYDPLVAGGSKANRRTLESAHTLARARDHLDRLGPTDRFVLVVHFYDPHAHYVPNPMFPGGRTLESRYDAEVAYTDHHVGLLLDHLEARGLDRDVAVLLVGDHGEEHWEHRYQWHRARVYEESVRVPMLLRVPGAPGGITSDRLVSAMDVAPTLLDLLGVPISSDLEGVSLRATLDDDGPDDRALLLASDIVPTHAIVRGHDKLIANLHTGVVERYDLARDPGERTNLADVPSPVLDDLRCLLADRVRATRAPR